MSEHLGIAERFAWLRAVMAAQPRPTLTEVGVAIVLAETFNAARGASWPSARTIAGAVRMERSNVRRAITALADRGYIAPVEKAGRSRAFTLTQPIGGCADPPRGSQDPRIGGCTTPERGSHNPRIGGSPTPVTGVPQPPEQVFRSEHVGIPFEQDGAASARRVAEAPRRARGAAGDRANRRRSGDAPVNL